MHVDDIAPGVRCVARLERYTGLFSQVQPVTILRTYANGDVIARFETHGMAMYFGLDDAQRSLVEKSEVHFLYSALDVSRVRWRWVLDLDAPWPIPED